MASNNNNSNVKVAVRIRPKLQREEIDMCNVCTRVTPGEPQVLLGHDKAFTFDYVFDMSSKQSEIYDNCVASLVEGCFEGYNATVLAYGQTGSGKTYTMGTGFDVSYPEEQKGIIPRAVEHLFRGVRQRQENARKEGLPIPDFTVTAQFIEIYNEELIDLLTEKRNKGALIRIQEDLKKGISLVGVETRHVSTVDETLQCLKAGSLFRTTGATLMNAESSRSHAIFTLFIKQNRVDRIEKNGDVEENGSDDVHVPDQEVVTLTAKFNFVDLAGSERLSRTGAVGERAREGISINSGLLHLGNVISALGDRSKKMTHVPYRDSKLTRVLQDSLGGNSVTTMIACISPCDRDFVETLNTLRYANRAKNIKNKVVANQDSQMQLINELRRQILQLQAENQELRQGKLFVKNDGEIELNDVYHENQMLQRELNNANIRIKALNIRLDDVNEENVALKLQLAKGTTNDSGGEDTAESLIKGYLKEIGNLRSKVVESEHLITYYRKQLNQRDNDMNDYENGTGNNTMDILEKAKQDIELGKSYLNNSICASDTNGNRFSDGLDDDQDDYSGEEDNDEELEKKLEDHNFELANLMENLASKERLIQEFEAREKRIIELTAHYEQKIASFKFKIKQIEEERDSLMQKIKKENKDDNISKAKKEEYEKKLVAFQNELRKYEALKREHHKVVNQELTQKERMKKLRQEILEAKQQRVKLIAQLREQMGRHNKEIQKNRLMINKLTREDHKKIVKIRDLEVQSDQQKKMLRRKDEEIKNLRRLMKPMSDKVAGRFYKRNPTGNTPQKARNKWHMFEQKFNKIVNQRLTFELEEKKLERYFQDRQKCIDLLNTLKENDSNVSLAEDLEAVKTNIEYLSKCIEDSQNVIMQLEDETINIEQLFNTLDSDEVAYIMDKLASSAINYAITASQREEELKEKEANLNNLMKENIYSTQLLNYMVSNVHLKNDEFDHLDNIPDVVTPSNEKFRRLTMTPTELLYFQNQPINYQSKDITELNADANGNKNYNSHDTDNIPDDNKLNATFLIPKVKTEDLITNNNNDEKPPPIPPRCETRMIQSLHGEIPSQSSSSVIQKTSLSNGNGGTVPSAIPTLNKVSSASSLNEQYLLEQQQNIYNGTPPGSPSVNRRGGRGTGGISSMSSSMTNSDNTTTSGDVFSRLTGGNTTITNHIENSVGQIIPNQMKPNDKIFPLALTHTVVGHRHPVLSVTATNEVLFSGSKDGTAKIWDLTQCLEVFSLNDHPDAVNVVRYDEYNKRIFTCSKSIIKVWDPRQNPINCVKTLNSGLNIETTWNDTLVYDMRLSSDGFTLFSTSERLVRIWDLRTFQSPGKLNTGHKSFVTCLAVENDEVYDSHLVITGSKDHTVKVFELGSNVSGIHIPKYTLKPPHYDGIEALCLTDKGEYLFSGGRDGVIKKWSLTEQRCLASLGSSHRDWVLALDTFLQGTILLSACRGGILRAWNIESLRSFGEIQAHNQAVNDIATIPQAVFTASSDCTINLWQQRESTSPTEENE